jgi:sugar transferase EpsL
MLIICFFDCITIEMLVLFKQVRQGLQGKPCTVYKFRTMKGKLDKDGNSLPGAARLTSCGRFLRGPRIDELPELWNMLKGDMSILEPRPLLMPHLPMYKDCPRMNLDVAEDLARRIINIPSSANLIKDE